MSSPGCATSTGAIAARNRRRARLRLTAPVAPGTANATLETSVAPGSARTRSPRSVPRSRFPAPPQSGVARAGDAARSSRRSRSQALAALPTACLEHLTSARRRHTYAKAVRLTPVLLLGLVRPLDGRLSETLDRVGGALGTAEPDGVCLASIPRQWTAAPSPCEFTTRALRIWCARSACDPGRALLDSAGCSGSGKPFSTSHLAPRPPAAKHLSTDVRKLWISALCSAGQGEERVDRTVGIGVVGDQAPRVEPVMESGSSTASMDPQQLWQVAQEELRFQVVRPGYEAWLANAVLVDSDGHTFTVGVPTMFARDWVSERYVPLIRETLSGVLGRDCEVIITVDPEASPPPEPPHTPDPTYAQVSEPEDGSQRLTAQPGIHLQHVRRRQLEPVRARRVPRGRRGPGQGVQPAVPLRRRGSGQDASDARDRPRGS